jgi:hypothetical protein
MISRAAKAFVTITSGMRRPRKTTGMKLENRSTENPPATAMAFRKIALPEVSMVTRMVEARSWVRAASIRYRLMK